MCEFGIILLIIGSFLLIFRDSLIKLQGPSINDDYPLEVRKTKFYVGSIGIIIIGVFAIIRGLFFE